MSVIMILIGYCLTVAIDMFMWWRLKKVSRKAARIWMGTAIACWVWMTVIVCLPRRGEADILPIMWMLYLYIALYLSKLVACIVVAFGMLQKLWHSRPGKAPFIIGGALGIILLGTMLWGCLVGRRQMQINRIEVSSAKIPEAFNGFRIVQFSDMHVGTWGKDTTFVSQFVDSINALRPDLILFTGDIVNRRTSELTPFLKPLSRLKAPYGVYSVLGNHDYGDYFAWPSDEAKMQNLRELGSLQKQMGWRLLNNDHRFITHGGDSIMLIGVENWGEPPYSSHGDMHMAYPDSLRLGPQYKILMSHNPEHWRRHVSKETDVDLTLSGHTHAMQIMLTAGRWRWSPAQYIYKNWAGSYDAVTEKGDTSRLYVNIGAGEVGMPYRIGAAPEITLITLHSTP